MKAVVIYESMFGNTHLVAEAIGAGLKGVYEVTVTPCQSVDAQAVGEADLVVVGAPTHAHGLTRPATRRAAAETANKDAAVSLDGSAGGPGVREWLDSLGTLPVNAAAFDTRFHAGAFLTGRASTSISKRLRRHGMHEVSAPESFFVTKENRLEAGEYNRARTWGSSLASLAR